MPFNSTATPKEIVNTVEDTYRQLSSDFGSASQWPADTHLQFQQLLHDGISVLQPAESLPLESDALRVLYRLRVRSFESQTQYGDLRVAAENSKQLGSLGLIFGDLGTVAVTQQRIAAAGEADGNSAQAERYYRAAASSYAVLGDLDRAESATNSADKYAQHLANRHNSSATEDQISDEDHTSHVDTTTPQSVAPQGSSENDWSAYINNALQKDDAAALDQLETVLEAAGKTNGPNDDQLAQAAAIRIQLALESMLPLRAVADVHNVSWSALNKMGDAKKFATARDQYQAAISNSWGRLFQIAHDNYEDVQIVASVFSYALPFMDREFGPESENLTASLTSISRSIQLSGDADKLQEFAGSIFVPMTKLSEKRQSAELMSDLGVSLPREPQLMAMRKQYLTEAAATYDSVGDELDAASVRLEYAVDLASQQNFREAHDILQALYVKAQSLRDLHLFAEVSLHLSRSWAHAGRHETAIKVIDSVLNNFPVQAASDADTRRLLGKLMMDKAQYLQLQSRGNAAQAAGVRALVSDALAVFMSDGFTTEMAEANRYLATGQF